MNPTTIGFIAGFVSTVSLIPQVIRTVKTKQVQDISIGAFGLIVFGSLLWFIYGVLQRDLPIIVTNAFVFANAAIILACKVAFSKKTSH